MSRFRSKLGDPVIVSGSMRFREFYAPAGTWHAWTNFIPNTNWIDQSYKEMTDQKTPGYFRAERENKVKPISPMTKYSRDLVRGQDTVKLLFARTSDPLTPAYELELNGNIEPLERPSVVLPFPSVNTDGALQEALSRAQTDCWDALTWAAEFHKTVASIMSLRGRFDRLASTFVSKVESVNDVSTFVNLGGGVTRMSKLWLELRYAWRPMLYDMADIQEAVRRLMLGIEDPLQRAYATRTETATDYAQTSGGFTNAETGGNVGFAALFCSLSSSRTTTAHAAVGVQVTTRDILMSDGFVTSWELVPFSFIVDWFISIGDMIAAFSPFASGTLRYASLAVTKTRVDSYSSITVPKQGFVIMNGSNNRPYTTQFVEETYQRSVPAGLKPTVEFRVNLNAAKILDLVALWIVADRRIQTRLNRAFNRLTRKFGKYLDELDRRELLKG